MRLEHFFGHKVNNIIILTSPITYIALILTLLYTPFYFIWKFFKLNDIWFILFKVKHLSKKELNHLHHALTVRSLKSKSSSYKKWVNRKAMREVIKHLNKTNKI